MQLLYLASQPSSFQSKDNFSSPLILLKKNGAKFLKKLMLTGEESRTIFLVVVTFCWVLSPCVYEYVCKCMHTHVCVGDLCVCEGQESTDRGPYVGREDKTQIYFLIFNLAI